MSDQCENEMSKRYGGYLFVYFTGEEENGEQIYFAISEDGLHWQDLNHGNPVLYSKIGERGVRDPFIIRSPKEGKFFIIATDLRIASGKGWDKAQYNGSRSIIIWTSDDLINWSEEKSYDVNLKDAGCVWAPEAVYDNKCDEYMVFWASMVKEKGDLEAKQRIYYSITKDFNTFTNPEKYIERKDHVIDTTIIKDKDIYYRFSKDETTKAIILDKSRDLYSRNFVEINSPVLNGIMGVEGPAVFKFNDREEWCLMIDQFASGKGYLPLVTNNLASGEFKMLDSKDYFLGNNKKRHGSILNITKQEYDLILQKWGKTL